ncbi:MAG TPA: hypothetical protein VIH76_10815 [Candidatus Acidoferrales bacterium]
MVLVDVISQAAKSGLPVRDLKKEDFRLFDDRQEVEIAAFHAGARYDTRPVVLWLAVLCNEGGKQGGSKEFKGREALFRPALDRLDKRDTVGVAHWCDNGEARLDLLPTEDRDSPISKLIEILKPKNFGIGGNSNLVGEEAFRKMIRLIIRDAQQRNPEPLPAIVFLYGGRGAQPNDELNQLADEVLETSGIVFGIRDELSATESPAPAGRHGYFVNYMTEETGGEYLSAPSKAYAAALEMIVVQLHFRYELGFIPPNIDGKRHELKVELTKDTQERYKGARLRFRPEYIPVNEVPAWAR